MSIYLVLDFLLILLIGLFAPIGYWRGPVKELLVTGGVLFGILLADFWARPWGRDLADISSIGADGGAFVVAMAFIVTVTFILGYGSGVAIAPAVFGSFARGLGAAIALFNGILLVGFSLQYVRVFLLAPSTEEALYDSYVVSFLLDQIGWVLLAVALVSWPVLLGILIVGRRAYEGYDQYAYDPAGDLEYMEDTYYQQPATPRPYPPRVPATPAEESGYVYKSEPVPHAASPSDATRPIRVGDRPFSPDTPYVNDSTDPDMVTIASSPERSEREAPAPSPPQSEPVEPDDQPTVLAPGYSRCTNCNAVLAPKSHVCPVCGEVN